MSGWPCTDGGPDDIPTSGQLTLQLGDALLGIVVVHRQMVPLSKPRLRETGNAASTSGWALVAECPSTIWCHDLVKTFWGWHDEHPRMAPTSRTGRPIRLLAKVRKHGVEQAVPGPRLVGQFELSWSGNSPG